MADNATENGARVKQDSQRICRRGLFATFNRPRFWI